jgi:hypothetical protein
VLSVSLTSTIQTTDNKLSAKSLLQMSGEKKKDKVRDGPCTKEFAQIDACAKAKGVKGQRVCMVGVCVLWRAIADNSNCVCTARNKDSTTILLILMLVVCRLSPLPESHNSNCSILRPPQEKLEQCPAQTDYLIKCINKNPKFFYSP